MQYSRAFIFTKRTDLLPYFYAHYNGSAISSEQYARLKSYYERERNVQLILLVRYDGNKTICRIKCPINPMPVKGEFEASSVSSLIDFMRQNGWHNTDAWSLSMFR